MSLLCHNLRFSYPRGGEVLSGISTSIEPGSVTAIIGPNGAGKSTLVRLLAGLRRASGGTVQLGTDPMGSIPVHTRAQRIAFIEQRPQIAFDFHARKVVGFGLLAQARSPERVAEALERFGLGELGERAMGTLSVGQLQRVSFARAWVQIHERPDAFLLADEPCSAMDPGWTIRCFDQLGALARRGVGVGVVVHDLSTAARFADRAIVLDASGNLAADGSCQQALSEEVLSAVFEIPMKRAMIEGVGCVIAPAQPLET